MAQITGMKAITGKMNVSAPTILMWVRDYGFPARKIRGIWICDNEAIDRWRVRFCEGLQPLDEPADVKKKPPSKRKDEKI